MIKSKILLVLLLIAFVTKGYSQKTKDTTRSLFNLEINAISFGFGILTSKLLNKIPIESMFVVNSLYKLGFGIQIPELRLYWRNKIGISVGFDFYQSSLNKRNIVTNFPSYFNEYNVTFKIDNQDGLSPISGNFTPLSITLGVMGKFEIKRFSFVPFVSYLVPISQDNYDFNVNFKNIYTEESFERSYKYANKIKYSFKIGLDSRFLVTRPLYLGIRLAYMYYQNNGVVNYLDKYSDGHVVSSQDIHYKQKFNGILFQVLVGFNFGRNVIKKQ